MGTPGSTRRRLLLKQPQGPWPGSWHPGFASAVQLRSRSPGNAPTGGSAPPRSSLGPQRASDERPLGRAPSLTWRLSRAGSPCSPSVLQCLRVPSDPEVARRHPRPPARLRPGLKQTRWSRPVASRERRRMSKFVAPVSAARKFSCARSHGFCGASPAWVGWFVPGRPQTMPDPGPRTLALAGPARKGPAALARYAFQNCFFRPARAPLAGRPGGAPPVVPPPYPIPPLE